MCQAKIVDHWNMKYICLRPDVVKYHVKITYGNGHMKGRVREYNRVLCDKHAKTFRYRCNRKRERGHEVELSKTKLKTI